MPWNYAAFLDYAAGRVFLRKVGGGYIFVHRMLLEYFAALAEQAHEEYWGRGVPGFGSGLHLARPW